MEQKEYWELFLVQGKEKIWLKTYEDSRAKCINDIFEIAKKIKPIGHTHIREIWKPDSSTYDFGSHTTFFEIEKVVKNEDN